MQILQTIDGDWAKEVFGSMPHYFLLEADSLSSEVGDDPQNGALNRTVSPGSLPQLGADSSSHQVACEAEKALVLPQALVPKWVTAAGPEMDLRTAILSNAELSRLLAAISHAPPGAVTTLHLAVPRTLSVADIVHLARVKSAAERRAEYSCCYSWCRGYSEENTLVSLAFRCSCEGLLHVIGAPTLNLATMENSPSAWGAAVHKFERFRRDRRADGALCCTRGCTRCHGDNATANEPDLLVLGAICDSCGSFCIASDVYAQGELKPLSLNSLQLQDTATTEMAADSLQLLCMLGGDTSLCHLQHLGLHGITLSLQVARALGHVFQSLFQNMTALTVTFPTDSIGGGKIFASQSG